MEMTVFLLANSIETVVSRSEEKVSEKASQTRKIRSHFTNANDEEVIGIVLELLTETK